jgi:preprotein translocase subunit SecF
MGLSRRERREQRRKLLKDQRLGQLKSLEEQEKHFAGKKEYKGFLKVYDKHYMKLLIIPILLFLIAVGAIIYQISTTGDFMNKGVSLKGGMVITIPVNTPVSQVDVENILKSNFPQDDIEVRSIAELGVQKAIIITTDNLDAEEQILEVITPIIPNASDDASTETTGSSLGGGFFKQTMIAMLIAFVCMGIVVFISFRQFVPSMMVILAVFVNIVETLAVVNLLGIKISTAGIASFLMLIGYSVDTDVLLTSRVLKGKEGTVFDRVLSAAKTGLLMTFTAITSVTIGLIMSSSGTIKEIMTIVLIGLIFDIVNTWIQNVALLRYYLEHFKWKKAHKAVLAAAAAEEEEYEEEEAAEVFEEAEAEVQKEEKEERK